VVSLVFGFRERALAEGGREDWGQNLLPVVEVAVCLCALSAEVGQMASEEEIVRRSDGEGVAHEGGSVNDQGTGHGTGDTI
jgi:hypothetical protein